MLFEQKYNQSYCAQAEEVLARGKSLASVCVKLGIARSTLYKWRDDHPEFAAAIERGLQHSQEYWENIGEDGITGKADKFAGTPWMFVMKSRFREDYAEREQKSAGDAVIDRLIDKLVD